MLTLRAIPFPVWNPKKGSIFPPQDWGFFLSFFCCCYCTFAPEGLIDFSPHFQFWQAYSSDSGLLVCCLAAHQQTSVAYWEDTLHVPGLEGGFETHFLEPIKKHCLGLKPRPPYGLVGPDHLIPSILGPFLKNTASHTHQKESSERKAKDGHPHHQD